MQRRALAGDSRRPLANYSDCESLAQSPRRELLTLMQVCCKEKASVGGGGGALSSVHELSQ